MAKRRRLEMPPNPLSPDLETKSALPTPAPHIRMPIADVAGETAGRAALEEVAREMTKAEQEGRVIKKLALKDVSVHHLSRDRMVLDEAEMKALQASISARGQQTPIEVVDLGATYGLISGLRRIEALRALGESHVLALIKRPDSSQSAYQAMIEENEIRAGLSFYERANIAVAAVAQRIYPNTKAAVKELFANTPKAKRSKILKFVILRDALGATLKFPTAIPEHLGLALSQALAADPELAAGLGAALKDAKPKNAAAERAVLEAALKRPVAAKLDRTELAPGLVFETKAGRAVLSGSKVDDAFLAALRGWAERQLS